MRVLAVTSSALFAAVLGACATPQENPNYQFSSTYTGTDDRAATQSVAYTPVPAPALLYSEPDIAQSHEVYTRVPADCVESSNAYTSCNPEGVASLFDPVVSEPWESPTEDMFAGGETTPGFRAVEGSLSGGDVSSAPAPAPMPAPTPAPSPSPSYEAQAPIAAPILRDQGSVQASPVSPPVAPPVAPLVAPRIEDEFNTLTISGPIVAAEAQSGTMTRALMHRVETGDTVYSLARRYCTSVDAIKTANGLGNDYAISLGADLKLPSNCR